MTTHRTTRWQDLLPKSHLAYSLEMSAFPHVQQVAKNLGFTLLRDYEGTSLDTLRQMIGTGMGISFLPSLYVRSEISPRNDVIILDIGFDLPHRQIAMAYRPSSMQKQLYQQIGGIIRAICNDALKDHVSVCTP